MKADAFAKRWLLPPGVARLSKYVRSFRGKSTVDRYVRRSDKLFVLANGPSLTKDVERYEGELLANDCLAVNYIALSDLYARFKPKVYLLCDPAFFADFGTIGATTKDKTVRLLETLAHKTTWPMTLVVPDRVMKSEFITNLDNPNVTVVCYASRGLRPERDDDFSRWMKGRCPPVQTVTGTAVFLGVYWRYPETWLLGADTSLHRLINVEQDTNRLYWMDEHFYGTERCYAYKDETDTELFTMSELLRSVANMFQDYELIRKFADHVGVKVVNASSFSFIDAFERAM